MPTFTVQAVDQNIGEWQSQAGGTMKRYRINLVDQDGKETLNVEWSRKAASPPPVVGESLEGTLESTSYGWKFKKAQTANGFGPRGRDPKESKRIAIQHGQKAAIDILKLAKDCGIYNPPDTVGEIVIQVKTVAASLLAQVEEVGS